MDNDSVKDNIRNFRKIYKLTQSEMADKLGISRTAYRNIESGETRLISENVSRIADILHIRTEDLVLGYSPEPGQKEKNRRPGNVSAQLAEMKRAHEKETEEMSSEIIRLKKEVLREDKVKLSLGDVLTALSICAATNPIAEKAMG